MSTKLRDLIRNIRTCKTAAEERALIKKEQALIRESFSANESEYRPRNVAKLLFISMLGYETDFAQMECLHLITANTYNEKRIGYLALTQLFNEKSEVLMMATNRIRIDLNNPSNYIVSLALMALSEVCTSEMCRSLSGEVLKLLQNGTAYIKKKAALASTRIVTRVPEKIDEFSQKVELLLDDRHHGVLVASLQLAQHILQIQPDQKQRFQKFVQPMVRIFKSIYSTYSAEYDIGGVSDPFLQIEILKYFRIMCQGNVQLSGEVSDILTQVAANTNNTKNSGNAVLYECVKTIFAIESSNTLKTLGINILGKFLQNKDANSKYISLFMLQKVLKHDLQAVQKHKQTILECLKENDNSIKTLALDLLYVITNETNVKGIVKELLNVLLSLTEEDADFTKELTNKICQIVEKYAPSRRWYIDTFIKILILAGNYVEEESSSSLIHLIIGTPELQSYAIHKLFFSLQENLNQEGLARTTAYCIGDFGHLLLKGDATAIDNTPIQITEEEILDLLTKLLEKPNQKNVIKEYVLSALIKLYPKINKFQPIITKLIQSQINSTSIEVSKRAQEYYGLLDVQWDQHRAGICEQIPPSDSHKAIYDNKPIGDVEYDEYPPAKTELEQAKPVNNNDSTKLYGFDIENLIGNQDQNQQKQQQQPQITTQLPGDLFDPFDITLNLSGTQPQTTQQSYNQLSGIGEFPIKQETQQQQQQQQPINPLQNLYNQNINLYQQQQQFPFQQQQQQPLVNLPGDIFDLNLQPQQQQQQKSIPQNIPYIMQQQQQQQQQQSIIQPQTQQPILQQQQIEQKSLTQQAIAFDDGALQIEFRAVKETPDQTNITAYFNNKTASPITELQLSFAVLKYMKLQLTQPTSSTINGNSTGQVISTLKITNSNQGQKGIVMKIKVSYKINGLIIDKEVTFNKFPPEY